MIKIFYGSDSGFTTHKVMKELKGKEDSIIRFDGYKDLVDSVIEDCSSISLFGDKKIVLFSNCYFLSASTKKGPFTDSQQGNYKSFIQYLDDPNEDTDLYIVVDGYLKKSGELYEAIKDSEHVYLNCVELPSDDEYSLLANKLAMERNKKIDKEAIVSLLDRCRTIPSINSFSNKSIDYLTFMNSIDKLFIYTDHVSKDDVKELIYKPLEDNVFDLINYLVKKDTDNALAIYKDLRRSGIDPLYIIPALASRFKEYAMIKYLLEKNSDFNEIASTLSSIQGKQVKSGSIYYRKQELAPFTFKKLLKVLSDLGEIEMGIKLYQDDGDTLLKIFITCFSRDYMR